MKKVSVILTTYNGATRGFLSFAIESVLNQTHKNFELLLVDDGSMDDTQSICNKYLGDERVCYLRKDNGGVATARNYGVKYSKGVYICFLDDDDVWLSDKLERQVALVEKLNDPNFGLCYTALETIDTRGERTGVVQSHTAHGMVFKEMLCENLVDCTSSVMIPKTVLDNVGFFRQAVSPSEDYDMWLRIAKKYSLYSVDKPLVLYREHLNKLSANVEKIEFKSLQAVFDNVQDQASIDKSYIYNQRYKKYAAYRFWLEDYKVFRRYVKIASAYGHIDILLRLRVLISYFPLLIQFFRKIKTKL